MKKKIIFKTLLSFIAILFFVLFLVNSIKIFKNCIVTIEHYNKLIEQNVGFVIDWEEGIKNCILSMVYSVLYCIPPLILLIVTLFSDFEVIRLSLIKTVKEYISKKDERQQQRETKRQSKIQRKIAQKQAEIESLNNSAKNK